MPPRNDNQPWDAPRQPDALPLTSRLNVRRHSPSMPSCLRALVPLLLLASACLAEPATRPANPFAAAIASAQKRCVKIYGAGIAQEHGYACGILVSADGTILTAQGLALATTNLRVMLPDGQFHIATLVKKSEPLQAAILKIDAATPEYFELARQNPAKKGDWVLAMNNAFNVAGSGESLSVNLGVVSLVSHIDAKRKRQDVPYDGDAMVIDAITSNPGAPGGAVVTADGRLAGMIGRILESKSTNTRVNYAVPVERLRAFVLGEEPTTQAVAAQGKPFVGVSLFLLGGKRAPAYIDRIVPGSPAAEAGLKKDDLILSINSRPVRDCDDYKTLEATLTPGSPANLTIKRKSQILQIKLTVAQEASNAKE